MRPWTYYIKRKVRGDRRVCQVFVAYWLEVADNHVNGRSSIAGIGVVPDVHDAYSMKRALDAFFCSVRSLASSMLIVTYSSAPI